jgi:hypothetical protein
MHRIRSPFLTSALLALALTLLSRGYEGIRHDGTLYLGQLLLRRGVHELASDPFFLGGSQDSYSLFSLLLNPVASGRGWAFPLVVLACIAATSFALLALVRKMCGSALLSVFGLVAVMCASPLYGGMHLFGYAEAFLTARTVAEPLVLMSLLPLTTSRFLPALGLQLAAAAFHPLMALPALVMSWLLASARDRRWLWLLALPAAAVGTAATGRVPWSHWLLQTYDADWWTLVSQANAQVVTGNWTLPDWLTVATDMAAVATAASRLREPGPRRLVWALFATATGLMLFAVVAIDVLHWVLPTQLQLWRVLWLVHLFSLALAPWLVWQRWSEGGIARLAAALVVLALVSSHVASAYGAPLLVGWLLCEWGSRRGWVLSASLVRFGVAACALAVLVLSAAHVQLALERLHWHPLPFMGVAALACVLTEPAIALALTGVVALGSQRGAFAAALAWAGSLTLLVVAAACWDQRDALAKAVEEPPAERPFRFLIPENASVFWPDHLAATWGLLHRVSHYERQQGAGILFNRATAEIIGPRREAYRLIRQDKEGCEAGAWMNRGSARDLAACQTPATFRLRELCASNERPDFMIFETPTGVPALATWNLGEQRFDLYRCSQFAPSTERPAVQNDRSTSKS